MDKEYGKEVKDQNGILRGTGLGLAGEDQLDPSTANWAMTLRIQVVLDACSHCSSTDLFISAALAQNGSGFDKQSMKDLIAPENRVKPIGANGETINWSQYFGPNKFGLEQIYSPRFYWDTRKQLGLFVNDVQALQKAGWYVSDVDWNQINNLK